MTLPSLLLAVGLATAAHGADPRLNPAVRPETIGATICRPSWTRGIRPPTAVTQRFERRHLPAGANPRAYVVDHRIPLGLGGHPGPANLQLQTVAAAKRKDREEDRLHRAVCAGRVPLREAQDLMAGWR